MRAIKRVLVFCLIGCIVFAAGCGGTESASNNALELINGNLETETTYRLNIAQPQTVGRELELSANPGYFLQKSVRTDAEYVLVDMRVDRTDSIKKGDVIAVLQGLGSKMDAEQKRLERDAFAAGAAENEAYYETLLSNAENLPASTASEAAIRELKIEYARADLELYRLQTENTLKIMEETIAAMERAAGEIEIYSPADGQIRSLTSYREGEILPAGTELCVINEANSQRIFGLSGNGTYVYGREVEVTLGRAGNQKTYSGRIVSSPEVQGSEFYSTEVYISIDEKIDKRSTDGKAIVRYTVLDGVIAIPSNAVTVIDGKATVKILEGDSVHIRSIVRGPTVGSTVTVLQGIDVGDQIVVSSYNS